MNQMIEIHCENNGNKVLVPSGINLLDVMHFAGIKDTDSYYGAALNNKIENLYYKIYSPKNIRFLDIKDSNGRRMYALSLMFLTYKAMKDIYPQSELYILHSMNSGYYAEVEGCKDDNVKVIANIKAQMKKLIKQDIPFEKKIIPYLDAANLFDKLGLNEKAALIRDGGRFYTHVDFLGDTPGDFFFEMVPSTGYIKVFDIVPYESGLMIVMPDKEKDYKEPSEVISQKKIFSIFQEHKNWVSVLHTPYVTSLNKIVNRGETNSLIQVAEALHEKKYSQIADMIYKKKDNVKIVFLAGPSSSGKTTSCRRIATQLAVLGLRTVQISMDDYFNDRAHTPKDANGEYDFESLEALDLDFFNRQMQDLLAGKEIGLPRFNFITGQREMSGKHINLGDNSIIIVEGIHALNPELSKSIARKNKFFVFVSALTQLALDRHNLIYTSDNRLIRRIVRDNNYRGATAENTIMRWESVRRGEEQHIFPYQENADAIFNSSLLYEIGLLKTYCEPLLYKVLQTSPAYAEARRLIRFLANFAPISAEFVPPTSIIREFLGGSSFSY